MTFLYLSDTAWGSQRASTLPDLLAALARWLREHIDIDFVLHGGNLLDRPEPELQRQAASLFQLPVPCYLCPGPHDLGPHDPEGTWHAAAPQLFPHDQPLYWTLELDGVLLQTVAPEPDALAPLYAQRDQLPRLVCTHQAVLGAVSAAGSTVADRLLQNRSIRGVLASHNRYRSHVERRDVPFLAAGSFLEPPHPFYLLSISADQPLQVTAVELGPVLPAPPGGYLDPTYTRLDPTYTRLDTTYTRRTGD